MSRSIAILVVSSISGVAQAADVREAHADVLQPLPAADVKIGGYVGHRLDRNLRGILMHKDENALLEPFRERGPKQSAWVGEHIGKWLSAASWMYAYSHDEQMLAKLKRVAGGLVATQMPDGYLGTYADKDRWTGWDVWIHKYNMLGLLDYYDVTGDIAAIAACRKMGDLLVNTFGPDKRDILKAGEHLGMASASILEPVLMLYRRTEEQRYLEFANYIVEATERSDGPRIISTLLKDSDVQKVANAKAYEMLSDIIGMIDLHRISGDDRLLRAAMAAGDDIIRHRLYITGGCTFGEHFRDEGYLPNAGHVAETCVTMSLMQFYHDLQGLTADVKYADSAENLILNHLLACQRPDGERICYYTPLWGHKFYFDFLGCCISSGPRALAIIPSMYYLRWRTSAVTATDAVGVYMIGESTLDTTLPKGAKAHVEQRTDHPFSGRVLITASDANRKGYSLSVRIPTCAPKPTVTVGGQVLPFNPPASQWLIGALVGDSPITIEIDLHLTWKIIEGTGANTGLFALQYGPVVYAFDLDANHEVPGAMNCAFDMDLKSLAPQLIKKDDRWTARVHGHVRQADGSWKPAEITLLPFADAGVTGYFSVWLIDRARYNPNGISLFTQVHENTSRPGTNRGSFADNSTATFTSTDNGEKRDQDWFEVDAGWHAKFNVIVFRHGKATPAGGWFDTSKGKPKILLKSWHDYKEVAEIADYPATTATSPGTLTDGQAFRVVIPKDKREPAFRVRVTGTPAAGNSPAQNSASCSEIQVFYDPTME
ncbi:MAG TPA: glycoside hydrolase family 127 protein [Phycisphaerae bacterium]|nr:glycoside hydrolase family 127 protein [Phycisphaerae bacterium]HRR85552.1 glycoside hydrolase family 127 protein [Phycisphaerae bacterium]